MTRCLCNALLLLLLLLPLLVLVLSSPSSIPVASLPRHCWDMQRCLRVEGSKLGLDAAQTLAVSPLPQPPRPLSVRVQQTLISIYKMPHTPDDIRGLLRCRVVMTSLLHPLQQPSPRTVIEFSASFK
ncbi:GL25465 [Drosophila persimilis]|uniref:GL25465 n=1 Tax=Drosophila persimilis TaxID=7234 RepID=B4GU75_DROPE|nr:GL25465 [Drosophila persimilis]